MITGYIIDMIDDEFNDCQGHRHILQNILYKPYGKVSLDSYGFIITLSCTLVTIKTEDDKYSFDDEKKYHLPFNGNTFVMIAKMGIIAKLFFLSNNKLFCNIALQLT